VPDRNVEIIKKGVRTAAPRLLVAELRKETSRAFLSIRNQMIAEFLSHPITQEIQAGPDAPNISGTLNGRGNLFSFIGFDSGDDPIEPILKALESSEIVFNKLTPNGIYSTAFIPSPDEIFEITPMPWASGRSWAHGIESGISGLGWHIKQRGLGRSGGGIQSSHQVSGNVKFRNVQYISALLNKYTKILKSL
jgi:hypothetical protein